MIGGKDFLELNEAKNNVAIQIGLKKGLLRQCSTCSEIIYLEGADAEPAYKYANFLISRNDPSVQVFNGDRTDLTDRIQNLRFEILEECRCQRIQDE